MPKPWRGRLPDAIDSRAEGFTESISVDCRLAKDDIRASVAHAAMLAEVGLLPADESHQIIESLAAIGEELASGQITLDPAAEDIHMLIEGELIRRLGDVGRKLHTGRSRNDQVVTDLKLWLRRHLDELDRRLQMVQRALVAAAERHRQLILPAYTHLQRAQPILAAHYFLAYVEKLDRDRGRVRDCRRRMNILPLGAAAVAGTSLPIDRRRVAEALGFDDVTANSVDTASDRDFVVESIFVLTVIAEHLSGWAEEGILWSTTEFGFLRLPDTLCTGSSIMPHKKNPDVLELIRGKTARVVGSLQTLLVLIKGLPLAYNRDLQEDKAPLFDAMDTVLGCLEIAEVVIMGSALDSDRIAQSLDDGFLDATTLMEHLIRHGLPMRTAHEQVGGLVRLAEERRCSLAQLDDGVFESRFPGIGVSLKARLGAARAVESFTGVGSTSPEEVNRQLEAWNQRLHSG